MKVIPPGDYCYTYDDNGRFIICPYWWKSDEHPEQENGFCRYMNKGDWEFDHLSLLWDQVKECGVNLDDGI